MCHQLFVYHACGHTQIVEQACELAKDFDVALWAKHLCVFYTKEGMHSRTLCGKGQFYCGQTGSDGHFLDTAHDVKAASDARLEALDAQLSTLAGQAREFTRIADDRGIPQELRKQHHAFALISRNFSALMRARIPLTAENQRAKHIIAEGLKWCQVRKWLRQRYGPNAPLPPLVVNPLNVVPLELQAPPGPTQNPLAGAMITHPIPIAITQQAIDVSQGAQTPAQTATHMPSSEGSNIDVAHVRRDRTDPQAVEKVHCNPISQKGQRIHMVKTPELYGSPSQENLARRIIEKHTGTKQTRRSKRKASGKTEADTIESEARPKRKCTKRVVYAESQTSDVTDDRDSSPEKYQESPEKTISVYSESPEPSSRRGAKTQSRKSRKSGTDSAEASESPLETLATKIGDWRKRRGDDDVVSSGKSASAHQASGRRKRTPAAEPRANEQRAKRPMVSSRTRATQLQYAQCSTPKTAPFGFEPNPLAPTLGGTVLKYGGGKRNAFNSYLQQGQNTPPVQLWSVQRGTESSTRGKATRAAMFSLAERDPAVRARAGSVFNHEESNSMQSADHPTGGQATGFAFPRSSSSTYGDFVAQQSNPKADVNGYASSYKPVTSSDYQIPVGNNKKADSVMGSGENLQSGDFDFNKRFGYNSMRGSLEDPFTMSPPQMNSAELHTTDPKKRALPASSPIPPARDMQLSMPEQMPVFDTSGMRMQDGSGMNHGITLSSPARISSQLADMSTIDGTSEITKKLNAPETHPAPTMTPSDVFHAAVESPVLPELEWNAQPSSAVKGVGLPGEDHGAAADLPSNAANGFGVQGGDDEAAPEEGAAVMTDGATGGEPGADFDWEEIQQWFAFEDA